MKLIYLITTVFICSFAKCQTLELITEDNFDWNTGAWYKTNTGNEFNYLESVTSIYSIENNSLQVINYNTNDPWLGYSAGYISGNSQASKITYRYFSTQNYYNLELSFTWKCNGEAQKDYGTLSYSLDGVNWTTLKDYQAGTGNDLLQETIKLPKCIENGGFYLGFSFTADNSFNFQPGIVVDNLVLKGTNCISNNTPTTPTNPSNTTVCYSNSQMVTLTANTNAGNLRWYKEPWCVEPFHQGINLHTLPTATTKYYVTALNTIGCESVNKLEINLIVRQLPDLTDTTIINAVNGGDGSISASVVGTLPLTYNWTMEGNTNFSGFSPTLSYLDEGTYSLTVIDNYLCQSSFSFFLGTSAEIIIPKGISPNGDGYNDYWVLEGIQQWPDFILELRNTRGELMYRQTAQEIGSYAPFNGLGLSGSPLPAGDYTYFISSKIRKKKYIGILSIKYE
jgi:gliding motility-associated-like protein